MKVIWTLIFLSLSVLAKENFKQSSKKNKANQAQVKLKEIKPSEKAQALLKGKEDCDDKAKKPIEIKPETISLSGGLGGNTGCKLEE